ncbi:MAG: carboxypeptidase-like regulatory domain-containing protein [Bacteroides sp.]|nr:carboxypeptidase-like regulatory domain-containing protein [Bacteroides sp.]
MRILLSILILLGSIHTYSQQIFRGIVTDHQTGKGIEDAAISLLNEEKATIDFAYTDKKGLFMLSSDSVPNFIMMSCMGYERLIIPIEQFENGGTFTLQDKGFKIKEVKVSSNRILEKKDTLVYSVSGFQMPQDRSIADVLKKMPGIEVLPSGQIKFEDKAISKLYIEGMDLMGERYSLATNNLSNKVVKEVQVLRNHQAISALRGKSFSEQAALNLVLTDATRYTFSGSADIGAGYSENKDIIWDIRFVGLLFGKQQQNLSIYKTNNAGENVSNEIRLQSKDYEIEDLSIDPLLSLPSISIREIDERRYLMNESHLFATNHLYKINDTSALRGQFTYTNKHDKQKEEKFSSFFYPDENVTIQEDNSLSLNAEYYTAEADYQLNDNKKYIRNYIIGNIERNRANNAINSNSNPIKTLGEIKKKDLSNYFQLISTYGNGYVFKILSSNSYHESPQKLIVSPGLYEETINGGKPYNSFMQNVHLRNFYSHTSTELQLKIAGLYTNMRIGVLYNNQQLTSSLYCEENNKVCPAPAENFYNDLNFADTKIYSTPSLRYKSYHWELRLDIPISYHQYQLNHKENNEKENKCRLYVEPIFNATYELNAYWKISNMLNFTYQVPDINHLYANYIFTNYRNAFSGSGFYDYKSLIYNTIIKFNNPLNGLFWSVGGSIIPNWQNKMLSTRQDNILSSNEMLDIKYRNLYWNVRTRLSKNFGWWKLFTGLTINYSQDRTKNLLSEEIIPYTSKNLLAAFNYSVHPCKYISIEGSEKYLHSALSSKITQGVYSEYLHSNLTINTFPTKEWKLKWNNQYLLSKKPIRSSIYFMDIATSYLWKKMEVELSINNILNKQNFQQTTYSSMSESTTLNYFRPREAIIKIRMNF